MFTDFQNCLLDRGAVPPQPADGALSDADGALGRADSALADADGALGRAESAVG
ncbi:hypothetical protein [Gordonia polyisoprenivorans]|uniref:hypothetical protein n=1 Tax=Gordonia polyisoprenivorans TaxID=84595 RepID=UPI001AD763CB|nr:hypothetical protein [Gordonia polyisoprenivorans]QTI68267.1 hypothetical protein J6U32_22650 [Gordonia polyisoprenivorans]